MRTDTDTALVAAWLVAQLKQRHPLLNGYLWAFGATVGVTSAVGVMLAFGELLRWGGLI